MMMGWDMGWNGGWMIFGSLMMILFWGGLIALLVLAMRGLTNAGAGSHEMRPQNQTPLQILQTRYAKGEIDRQEYEQMRGEIQAT